MSRTSSDLSLASKLLIVVLLVSEALIVIPTAVDALTCGEVRNALVPCVPYLATRSSLGHCCTGIRSLNSRAKTRGDRQGVCGCLKSLAAEFRSRHRLDFNVVQQLPGLCKVNIRYRITTPTPNCSQVQ